MGLTLRIFLLLLSVGTAIWILRKIHSNRVRQEDATYWICFAGILALLGIFPGISYFFADLLGIISPANFVFLAIIGLLFEKLFTLSIQVSILTNKLEILSAELALRTKEFSEKGGADSGKEHSADTDS